MLVAGVCCAVGSSAAMVGVARMFGWLVARGAEDSAAFWALGGLLFLRSLLAYGATYWLGAAAARVLMDFRDRFFAALLYAPLAFHDRQWSNNLVSALTSDAAFIEQALRTLLPAFARNVPLVLFGTLAVFAQNWLLSLTLTVVVVPLTILAVVLGRSRRAAVREGQETLGRLSVVAGEGLRHLRAIKSLALEAYFVGRFRRVAEFLLQTKYRRLRSQAWLDALVPVGMVLAAVVGLVLVQWQRATAGTTTEQTASYLALLVVTSSGMVALLNSLGSVEQVFGAADRVLHIRDSVNREKVGLAGRPRILTGALVVENVSYLHVDRGEGVRNISMRLDEGEIVALVGPNGAGKSTLVGLLAGLYQPQSGDIRLGEFSQSTLDLALWRRSVAVLTREPAIFGVSIRENIALGLAGASMEDIERAACAVDLHAFIQSLPRGYGTVVGEDGVDLSAGQRQRLALARVFLQEPSVIILDEATTSVDHESERHFQKALNVWSGRKTVLLVTHNLRDLWPVSRIVRMKGGVITGEQKTSRPSH